MQRGQLILLFALLFVQRYLKASNDLTTPNGSNTSNPSNAPNDLTNADQESECDFEMVERDEIFGDAFHEGLSSPLLPNSNSEGGFYFGNSASFNETIPPAATNFVDFSNANETIEPHPSAVPNSTVVNDAASASGRCGLENRSAVCYMNAFLASLFNIHCFRAAVYASVSNTNNSTSVMLAQVFAKLQTSKSFVRTKMCLMPAISTEMGWAFNGYQCNIEFGGRLLDLLPESVTKLYKISLVNDFKLKSNNRVLKSPVSSETHLIVPLAFPSISAVLERKFVDHQAEDYIIERKDLGEYAGIIEPFAEDRQKFPIYSEMRIANRPEMLIFGIRRKTLETFNNRVMHLDSEITLPADEASGQAEHTYLLHAFCYHTIQPLHYIAYVRDFAGSTNPEGDWYRYNDKIVTAVRTRYEYDAMKIHADRQATLTFYVRSDVVARNSAQTRISVPDRIGHIATLITTLEDIRDRKSDDEPRKMADVTESTNFSSSSTNRPAFTPSASFMYPISVKTASSPTIPNVFNNDETMMKKKEAKSLAESTAKIYDEFFPFGGNYY